MRQIIRALVIAALVGSTASTPLLADEADDPTIRQLQQQMDVMQDDMEELGRRFQRVATGFVLFLFAAFCALWAQNTNRDPWLWFFCGYLFHVLTVIVLLSKNADDLRVQRGEEPKKGQRWFVLILIVALIATAIVAAWRYLAGP